MNRQDAWLITCSRENVVALQKFGEWCRSLRTPICLEDNLFIVGTDWVGIQQSAPAAFRDGYPKSLVALPCRYPEEGWHRLQESDGKLVIGLRGSFLTDHVKQPDTENS